MLRNSGTPLKHNRSENEGLIMLENEDTSIPIPPTRTESEIQIMNEDGMDINTMKDSTHLDERVMKGLMRIKEFDMLLKEKNETARALKKERLKRDSQTGTPVGTSGFSTPSYHNMLSDDEEDEDHLELRSIHSDENPVFLTEPKFSNLSKKANAIVRDTRILIGKQALDLSSSTKKNYKPGDFIGRNIALGPDARFYHALTEDEKNRVENIIKDSILDAVNNQEIADTKKSIPEFLSAFTYERKEKEELDKIDSKLCLMTPQNEWDTKSLIHSSQYSSGLQTPSSSKNMNLWNESFANLSLSESNRDIDITLNDKAIMDQSIFMDCNARLKEIDLKLEQLTAEQSIPTDDSALKKLIQDIINLDKALSDQVSNYPDGPSIS